LTRGFSSGAATAFVTVITLTRRAKHWHDAIVAGIGNKIFTMDIEGRIRSA
jgi:hypothetical protein